MPTDMLGNNDLGACGQASVRIPQNPSAPHTITATTDVGAILVTYLGAGSGQGSAGQSIGN